LVEGGAVQAVTLTIGERQFGLSSSTDLAEFSARLTAAVQAGGGMVEIPVAGDGRVTVLISPGVTVVLEARDVRPHSEHDDAGFMPWLASDEMEI
jgi:hypothetical protein